MNEAEQTTARPRVSRRSSTLHYPSKERAYASFSRVQSVRLRSEGELLVFERQRQHLIDRSHQVEPHVIPHVGRDIIQIGSVSLGHNHLRQPGSVRGQHFLLEAADGEHATL